MKTYLKFVGLIALVISFCMPPTMAKADGVALSMFGVNDHIDLYPSDVDVACDEIIASGIKFVRIGPSWAQFEPHTRGVIDTTYEATVDEIINRLSAGGVQVDFILCFSATWASTNGSIFAPPANMTDWTNFVSFVTNRYNNKVKYWEVWNEEDTTAFWTGTPLQYVQLLQAAATQVRATNPTNIVLMGGLAAKPGQVGTGTFFDTIMQDGAGGSFDIINYHTYTDNNQWRTVFAGMEAVITKWNLGSMPIWITETGYTTNGNTDLEPAKAQYLEEAYYSLLALSPNIQKLFLYVHRNINVYTDNTDTTLNESESNFGLLATDRTPLLPFYHFQAIDGAESNFAMQTAYPSTEYRRTLNYITPGDGPFTNYAPDGSQKQVPVGEHMYFEINDDWLTNVVPQDTIDVDVTYLDSGTGQWELFYDSNSTPFATRFVTYTNTGNWLTKTLVLTDAKFANRQQYSADFGLKPVSSPLVVSSVNVRHDNTKGWVALGTGDAVDQSWLMWISDTNNTNPSSTSYDPPTTMGGLPCRELPDSSHFLYFSVAEALVPPADHNVTISVTYWDIGNDTLYVYYNSTASGGQSHIDIHTGNTATWKTYTFSATDAQFTESFLGVGDIFIEAANPGVNYINSVSVTSP